MGALILAVVCFVGYIIAYRTYGRFLARKIFRLDNGASVQRLFIPNCPDQSKIKTSIIREGPLRGAVMVSLPGKENIGADAKDATINLVPYYAWNNRGEKSMIVWFPRNAATP